MKQKLIKPTAMLLLVLGLTELKAQADLTFTGSQNSLVYQTVSDEGIEVFMPRLMAIFEGEPILSYVEKLKNNGYNVPKESTKTLEEQLQAIYGKFKNVPGNSLHVAESQDASKNYDAAKLLAQQGALNSLISNISSKVILVDNQTISKSNETICLDNVVYFELVNSNIENEVWSYYIYTEGDLNLADNCKNSLKAESTSINENSSGNFSTSYSLNFLNEQRIIIGGSKIFQVIENENFTKYFVETSNNGVYQYLNKNGEEDIKFTPKK